MRFVECSNAEHGKAIRDIFNDAIVNSTALYEYHPRSAETIAAWFEGKSAGGYPVIGAVDETDALLGFASYGCFRAWPAFKYSIEHSVYVHPEHRGKGVGLALMTQLVDTAQAQGYHVMVGGIDLDNGASIALHERLGFVHAGTVRQAGFKFGRWLDLGFWQLILRTPLVPTDG